MALSTPIRKALLVAGLFIGVTANAQYNWDFGFSVGASNYLGDIGGDIYTRRDFVADMKMQETHMSAGMFVRYRFNSMLYLKNTLSWARVSGDDKLTSNPARNARNLNFRNDIFEFSSVAQFAFYDVNDLGRSFRHKDKFRVYIGAGAGVLYHNPKAQYNGDYVALRPLATENVNYSRFSAVIPVTGGVVFSFDDRLHIGFDLNWRTTFTDYLDDVSTSYADPAVLGSSLAIELANRTDELGYVSPAFAENFTPGSKRGDASHNDSYLTSTVEVSYAFRTRSAWEKAKHGGTIRGDHHKKPSKYNGYPRGTRTSFRIRDGKLVRVIRPKW